MDVAALIVSVLALVFSYTSIMFSKQLEMKAQKFDELVLEELKSKFALIDKVFEGEPESLVTSHLTLITDVHVEIMLYVIAAREHFKGLNVDQIQDELQKFTDEMYMDPMVLLREKNSIFKAHKLKIMCLLYDQSIRIVTYWPHLRFR